MTGFRAFVVLWCGQFVSLTGSALSGFALGVYVYQLTGSATALGFVLALSFLPMILCSPFTGSLADRWGARRSLLVTNTAAMTVMLALATLLFTDTFAVWHVYVVVVINSALRALSMPAFESAVPLLVPKRHIGRANGMRMVALATSQVLAPVGAGFLLLAIDIYGIILMDFLSYGCAIVILLIIRIPRVRRPDPVAAAGVWTLLADFRQAWRYVTARRGLLVLLMFIGALNFSAGFVDLLLTPLVLAFESADALGAVLSIGGLGMIAAGVAMSVWGGPRRRVRGILLCSLVIAAATVLGSLRPNVMLIAAAAVLFLAALAIIIGCNQSIWQTKVEPQLLGRAMAMQNMVANTPQLLAYALAGLTADRVFEPLVGRDRVHSHLLTPLIGDGPGRGIALLLMIMGVLIALSVAAAAVSPRLRRLEDELPDMNAQEPEAGAVAEPVAART
jgi:MFS family permease